MSASREKKTRQDQTASGYVDPKIEKEAQQKAAEKRTNFLYGLIAVVFVLVVAATLIWRSNIIARKATAATINGENYTAAEANFFYNNAYRGFVNQNSYFLSYMGLDTSSSLKGQTINATAASMTGLEEGASWYDYFMDMGLQQMAAVQAALKQAKEEGFVFPDSVQSQYEETMASLKSTAEMSGTTVTKYLQSNMGSTMTEKVYGEQVLRLLQYSAYVDAHQKALTYSDAELEAAYKENTDTYDLVSYEYVMFKGTAESTKDAEGNTVQPTEEQNAAAKEAAKAAADALLRDFKASGSSLESLASGNDSATYKAETGTYYGDTITSWLFNSARKAGDCEVLEVGSNYYVVNFLNRYRDETNTIDVRHILIQPEAGTIASGEEGYDAEQAELKAAARKKAEDLLAQWKSGDATEDSFAALAGEYTTDGGSKYTGGLYSQVAPGKMVPEFNDWCFDSSRKPGDTGIVDTSYGSHVMYFVGSNIPVWAASVQSDLSSAATSEWAQSFVDNSTIQQNSFGMKFVG